jgi:hypothetical protein
MQTLAIELTLLGDVVQTADSATVGPHRNLGYLKGSNLLGAAAAALYDDLGPAAYTVFHSGRVRFLDAVPLTADGVAAIPVPLGWFRPKGVPYVERGRLRAESIHCLPHVTPTEMAEAGLEVIRGGHFTPSGAWLDVPRRYRLKTAVDVRSGGGPERGGLFGYEALAAGSRWLAGLELDDDVEASLAERLAAVFDRETVWLGRSRAAEYGRVEARVRTQLAASERSPGDAPWPARQPSRVTLVLTSDAALLDPETGEPTLSARAAHFGLPRAFRLDPLASQVVNRRYSPFNGHRGFRDTVHVVLGRGSVLTFTAAGGTAEVEIETLRASLRSGIGLFRQEGLGQVEVEPWYLAARHPRFKEAKKEEVRTTGPAAAAPLETPLALWMTRQSEDRRASEEAFTAATGSAKRLADSVLGLRRDKQPAPGRSQWNRLASVVRRHLQGREASVEAVRSALENEVFGTGPGPANVAANLWRQPVGGAPLSERVLREGLGDGSVGERARLLRLYLTALLVVRGLSRHRVEGEDAA